MFSAKEARCNRSKTENEKFMEELEEKIKEASADNERYITITIGDWNNDEFWHNYQTLIDNGYRVESTGCAGWNSYYYRISWH